MDVRNTSVRGGAPLKAGQTESEREIRSELRSRRQQSRRARRVILGFGALLALLFLVPL